MNTLYSIIADAINFIVAPVNNFFLFVFNDLLGQTDMYEDKLYYLFLTIRFNLLSLLLMFGIVLWVKNFITAKTEAELTMKKGNLAFYRIVIRCRGHIDIADLAFLNETGEYRLEFPENSRYRENGGIFEGNMGDALSKLYDILVSEKKRRIEFKIKP